MNQKVLLHICCACCATSVIECLRDKGYSVIGYFFNPNIYPEEEHQRRENGLKLIEQHFHLPIIREEYAPRSFDEAVRGHEQDPEGGKRCSACFTLRLKRTYGFAVKNDIPYFTTTLSVSAYKNFETIKNVGESLDKKMFIAIDFKKDDGFKKSIDHSKKLGLYRQKYCGCFFSAAKKEMTNLK